MSNLYQHHQKKVIKIKPIKRIKQPISNAQPAEQQLKTIQQKIEHAQSELHKLEEQKAKLIKQTEKEIQQKRERWDQEKETFIAEMEKIGYEEGFANGENESLNQYNDLITSANELVKTASKDYYTTIEQSKMTMIELAIHIAEKIINQQLSAEPQTFLPIVEAAIQTIKTDKKIIIYVHPNQYEFLMKQKNELLNNIDGQAQLEIFLDKNLQTNSCVIEHPFGQVDASVDTQLEQIRSVLQNVSNGE